MNRLRILARIIHVRWLLKHQNYLETVRRLTVPLGDRNIDGRQVHRMAATISDQCDRFPGTRCLARSLVLWSLLREAGHETEIRIGIRPRGAGIEAHAWVEWMGEALNEEIDPSGIYTPFDGNLSELQFN